MSDSAPRKPKRKTDLERKLDRAKKAFTERKTGCLPFFPTVHLPGTGGKIDVLAERFARREPLFHRRDKTFLDHLEGTSDD